MIRKGTYVLMLGLAGGFDGDVGALGHIRLDPGTYCYVGSAMGGLDQRVSRHLRKDKKVRWHIDRLTIVSDSSEAFESFPDPIAECELGTILVRHGAAPVADGFGCSDCGCRTHLFKADPGIVSEAVKDAGLVPFAQRHRCTLFGTFGQGTVEPMSRPRNVQRNHYNILGDTKGHNSHTFVKWRT